MEQSTRELQMRENVILALPDDCRREDVTN